MLLRICLLCQDPQHTWDRSDGWLLKYPPFRLQLTPFRLQLTPTPIFQPFLHPPNNVALKPPQFDRSQYMFHLPYFFQVKFKNLNWVYCALQKLVHIFLGTKIKIVKIWTTSLYSLLFLNCHHKNVNIRILLSKIK